VTEFDASASPTGVMPAGALLAQGREAAGLSVDAVAQQLKLAPRQIRALEAGDFAALPGRTFVRGFVRNYARLVHIDPPAALAALPDEIAAPSLERPSLAPTTRAMGEIPADQTNKPGIARWAIPLALIAVVAVAVVYEVARPQIDVRRASSTPAATLATQVEPVPAEPSAPATSTALPNPVTATPADTAAATIAPATETGTAVATEAPVVAPPSAPGAGEARLAFAFRGPSWVEVKDRTGNVLLSMTGTRGATQAVAGAAPLDVVVGNALNVDVTFGDARFDLAPHTKLNVSRFRLP